MDGSVAAGTERPGSDVDVMVLGSASFADVALALADVQAMLAREVNPTPMSAKTLPANSQRATVLPVV